MRRLILALLLTIPSLGLGYKFLNLTGLVLYIVLTLTVVLLHPIRLIPERYTTHLASLTFAVILIGFLIIYPIANSGIYGGGADADDALDVAGRALLHGEYPYYLKTYLGNRIASMPGAIILSLPFLIYGSALQNLFWLLVLYLIIRWQTDKRTALYALWLLLFSPVVAWNITTGTDELANTLYVLAFSVLLIKGKSKYLWAILLGISLSSRSNFILLVPIIFLGLVYQEGIGKAVIYTLITCTACALITLPFYLYDPQGFTPLRVQLSKTSMVVPLLGGLTALFLAWKYVRGLRSLLFACAIVQFVAVFFSAALMGNLLGYTTYGVFFSLFGIVGLLQGANISSSAR